MADGLEKKKGATSTSVEPKAEEWLPADYTRAEHSLETIGYFEAGYKRRYPNKATTDREGKVVATIPTQRIVELGDGRRITFTPTAHFGYANSEDMDFYRGFLKLCEKHVRWVERVRDGVKSMHPRLVVPITFSTAELLRASGKDRSAQNWKAAQDFIKRNNANLIEGGLFVAKSGEFGEVRTTLFQMSKVRGEKLENGDVADMNHVWPSKLFLSNYYYHYVQLVDVAFYQRLKFPIAKALAPILDQGWYATDGKLGFEKEYQSLCQVLGIAPQRYLSDIKRQMDDANRDLQTERFLERWEYRKSADGSSFVLSWWAGEKWYRDQRAREHRQRTAQQIGLEPSPTSTQREFRFKAAALTDEQRYLVDFLVERLDDERSRRFIEKVVRESHAPPDMLRGFASEATYLERMHRLTGMNKGAYFTWKVKDFLKPVEIPLPSPSAATAGVGETPATPAIDPRPTDGEGPSTTA